MTNLPSSRVMHDCTQGPVCSFANMVVLVRKLSDISCCGHRFVRLGTASLLSDGGGPFINLDKLDLRKYAARPCLAQALCDYMLHHEHNPKRALELCAHATASNKFEVCRSWFVLAERHLCKCCHVHICQALKALASVTWPAMLTQLHARQAQHQRTSQPCNATKNGVSHQLENQIIFTRSCIAILRLARQG